MSVYSEISRLTSLRNRLKTKLYNLGLLRSQNAKLADCTDAVESIDEETPYLISTAGIKNVAGVKYAQIDESAWVPAGTIPSGLESHLTGLGAIGIMSSRPRNPISIGTVYPNTGSQGMYANALEIDGDVIKPSNIRNGVQILGVTGNYAGSAQYGTAQSLYVIGLVVEFDILAPLSRIKTMYLQSTDNLPFSSTQIRSGYAPMPFLGNPVSMFFVNGDGYVSQIDCECTVTQSDASTWHLRLEKNPSNFHGFTGTYNLWYTYVD